MTTFVTLQSNFLRTGDKDTAVIQSKKIIQIQKVLRECKGESRDAFLVG